MRKNVARVWLEITIFHKECKESNFYIFNRELYHFKAKQSKFLSPRPPQCPAPLAKIVQIYRVYIFFSSIVEQKKDSGGLLSSLWRKRSRTHDNKNLRPLQQQQKQQPKPHSQQPVASMTMGAPDASTNQSWMTLRVPASHMLHQSVDPTINGRLHVRIINPTWSNGQDTWLSPRRPGFNSRCGRFTFF